VGSTLGGKHRSLSELQAHWKGYQMPRTYKKAQKHKDSFLCSNEIIISTKEARKLLGKADSDKISDLELANLIGLMHRIASDLIDIKIVHSGEKVV
jgi:hypothetical protein